MRLAFNTASRILSTLIKNTSQQQVIALGDAEAGAAACRWFLHLAGQNWGGSGLAPGRSIQWGETRCLPFCRGRLGQRRSCYSSRGRSRCFCRFAGHHSSRRADYRQRHLPPILPHLPIHHPHTHPPHTHLRRIHPLPAARARHARDLPQQRPSGQHRLPRPARLVGPTSGCANWYSNRAQSHHHPAPPLPAAAAGSRVSSSHRRRLRLHLRHLNRRLHLRRLHLRRSRSW